MAWGWAHFQQIFIFRWTIPINCAIFPQKDNKQFMQNLNGTPWLLIHFTDICINFWIVVLCEHLYVLIQIEKKKKKNIKMLNATTVPKKWGTEVIPPGIQSKWSMSHITLPLQFNVSASGAKTALCKQEPFFTAAHLLHHLMTLPSKITRETAEEQKTHWL